MTKKIIKERAKTSATSSGVLGFKIKKRIKPIKIIGAIILKNNFLLSFIYTLILRLIYVFIYKLCHHTVCYYSILKAYSN